MIYFLNETDFYKEIRFDVEVWINKVNPDEWYIVTKKGTSG